MLAKEFKLKNSEEIKLVLRQGKRARGQFLSLFFNPSSNQRAAVVVSKKVSPSAVGRNRVRRILFAQLAKKFADWGNQALGDMVVMVMSIPGDEKLLITDLEKCFAKLSSV